jgi:chromate reductase
MHTIRTDDTETAHHCMVPAAGNAYSHAAAEARSVAAGRVDLLCSDVQTSLTEGSAVGESVRIFLVSGSTRATSTNTAALKTVRTVAPEGVTTVLYDGLSDLPAFNPDDDGDRLHPAVAGLRLQLTAADAVLFCTPEYAGTLPGSLKNLLDWTVGGGQLYGKPVAWINVADPGRGEGALATLATVLGYVGAVIIEPACARLSVGRDAVGPDGIVTDPNIRAGLTAICQEILGCLRTNPQI